MKDDIIRASDIGLYVFCARAWRLKADGYQSQNIAEMAAGSESHRAHGERVVAYQHAQRWSVALFVLAIIVLVLWLFTR